MAERVSQKTLFLNIAIAIHDRTGTIYACGDGVQQQILFALMFTEIGIIDFMKKRGGYYE